MPLRVVSCRRRTAEEVLENSATDTDPPASSRWLMRIDMTSSPGCSRRSVRARARRHRDRHALTGAGSDMRPSARARARAYACRFRRPARVEAARRGEMGSASQYLWPVGYQPAVRRRHPLTSARVSSSRSAAKSHAPCRWSACCPGPGQDTRDMPLDLSLQRADRGVTLPATAAAGSARAGHVEHHPARRPGRPRSRIAHLGATERRREGHRIAVRSTRSSTSQ
jgi:hypothetical protein